MYRWAARVAGQVLSRWLRGIGHTVSLQAAAEGDGHQTVGSCQPLVERLLEDAGTGHVIVPFWSAHQLSVAMLAAPPLGLRPVLDRFEVVADDSFGGRMVQKLGEDLGATMRHLHASNDARRLADLGAWMREPRPFFIAVDGGTQYGTIPTGIIRLAARLGSTVRPIAVRAQPAMRVPGLVAEIPMRGAALALSIGPSMRIDRRLRVAAVADELKHRLNTVTERAGAMLARQQRVAGALPPPATDRWRQTG